MTPKLKKIIITIIILVVLFLGYAILKPDPTAEVLIDGGGSSASSASTQQARIIGAQISQALLKIDQIKLDRSIFDNPIYKSLKDKSKKIEQEPIGRTNPFAPLGEGNVISTTESQTTTGSNTVNSTEELSP